jgi:type VII secretion protein EccCa
MTARKFTPKYPAGPQPVAGEIALPGPTELGEEVEQKGWQKYLPAIMICAMVLLIGIMIFSGVRTFSPMYMMMPFFFIIMGIGYLTQTGSQSKSVPQIDAERKTYLRFLTQLRPRVAISAAQQVHYWSYHAPNPADLSGLVGGARQWSRQPSHDMFCSARIGTGTTPAADRLLRPGTMDSHPMSPATPPLVGPSAAPQPYLEPVSHVWLMKFVRTHGLIHDCPKAVNLQTHPTVSVGGDPTAAAGLLRAMICHLAFFHAPDDLQIRVVTGNVADPDWTWLKWLPHMHHPNLEGPSGKLRLIYADDDAAVGELSSRSPHASATASPAGPYHLIINLTGQTTYPRDGKAGVTYITLGQTRAAYQIKVNNDGTVYDRQPQGQAKERQWQLLGDADNLDPTDATRVARRLAGWTTSGDQVAAPVQTPTRSDTSWNSLIGVRSIDDITCENWQEMRDDDPNRLRFPVGHLLKTGEPFYLDIKEGSDNGNGPHGMLIGTTRSGKSSFITTMLLSAFATHHPSQLNVLLADFKGGTTFQGMANMPHVTAVITNLQEEADLVARMEDAIYGEIERREEILKEASRALGKAVPDVREYEKFRQAGYPLEPLPALFIVVDEFAMLLKAQPDFKEVFEAVTTVGGGLRMHLLLATQVIENVDLRKLEGNLAYRIALRTESPNESKSVIGTPEAAYIDNNEPGVGFVRFRKRDDPQRFRGARTDMPYTPADTAAIELPPPKPTAKPIVASVRAFTGYDAAEPVQEGRHARTAS